MTTICPRLILAGERGGVGKTTLSVGLLAAWRARDLPCAAFKKGPDYIDSAWLAAASGHVCRNLDTFLMSEQTVARSFQTHALRTGVNLIEGNRGLFDGVDPEGTFSTAEMAKSLNCPVIVVIDCEKRTRTTAAVALGCRLLDEDVELVGVILNRLGTARQERVARTAVERDAGLRVLGSVPRLPDPIFRERHLGLIPPQEDGKPAQAIEIMRQAAESHLDVEGIWALACQANPLALGHDATPAFPGIEPAGGCGDGPRIGYFLDSVFHFYYPENLEALARLGAERVAIDALRTEGLPPELDGLYIGGGFPEERAAALSANVSLRESVRAAAEGGMPIYAECGGLMYLGRTLRTRDGEFPMAGVFPFSTVLEPKPQGHGYVEAVVGEGHPFARAGSRLKGHEFHYSRPVDWNEQDLTFVLSLERGEGFSNGQDGIVYKNTFATYMHIHALGEPAWAAPIVTLCRKNRQERRLTHTQTGATVSAVR